MNVQSTDLQVLYRIVQHLYATQHFELAAAQCEIAAEITKYSQPEILKTAADCYYQAGNFQLAADNITRYIEIQQLSGTHNLQQEYQLLVACLRLAGDYKQAQQVAVEKWQPCPARDLMLGWLAMQQGDFKKSVELTAAGRATAYWAVNRKTPAGRQWTDSNTDIKNLRILVCGEAGHGDEIIFSRWIPKLKKQCQQVIYYTDNSLGAVFSRQFDIDCVTDLSTANYDIWVPAMQLPYLLAVEQPGNAAYLTPDPSLVEQWKQRLPKDKKIILVNWTGQLDHPENKFREVPLLDLVNLFDDSVQLISVQKNHQETALPSRVLDLSRDITTWDDTLAILSHCSAVVSCCTALAHAGAALGVKTAVLVNNADYFTWCASKNGEQSQWYPHAWVFRKTQSSWLPAIQTAANLILS